MMPLRNTSQAQIDVDVVEWAVHTAALRAFEQSQVDQGSDILMHTFYVLVVNPPKRVKLKLA